MVYDFGLGIAECFIGRHIVETRIEISPLHESSWILVTAHNWAYSLTYIPLNSNYIGYPK